MALRGAGIAAYNLVRVSSIFPPHCRVVSAAEGQRDLQAGQIIHCVISENASNEPGRLIAAAVGIAMPEDKTLYGYLSEHHSFGENEATAAKYAEYLAADMFTTIHKNGAQMKKHTQHITQVAHGDAAGNWTTVVACAVLLP
jgi:arginine decarboxylase